MLIDQAKSSGMVVEGQRRALVSSLTIGLAAAVYAAALWSRLRLSEAPPYGDEGLHFHVAKHLLALPANFHDVYGNNWWHANYLVFQRPAFYVLFHGPALASFGAFRAVHAVFAAALPVLAFFLLRSHGHTHLAALGAGLALALHPFFVTWGSLVLMDSLMACWFLAALLARRSQRWILSAALFLVAIWTKETAAFGVAALLAATWFRKFIRGEAPLWPLQLDRAQSGLLVALAAGLLPITVAMSRGLRAPGGLAHGSVAHVTELLTLSAWLLIPVLIGLALPASRVLCAWALYFVFFFLGLHAVAGRAVEAWYAVLPAALCVIAAASAIDAGWRSAGSSRHWLPAMGAIAFVALIMVAALVPASAAKQSLVHPLSGDPADSLAESRRYEVALRDQDLERTARFVRSTDPVRLLLFDVQYGFAYYPFIDQHEDVLGGSSGLFQYWPQPLEPLSGAIESSGTLTVIEVQATPLNEALRSVYLDCLVFGDGRYVVYQGWLCTGRTDLLRSAVEYPHA